MFELLADLAVFALISAFIFPCLINDSDVEG